MNWDLLIVSVVIVIGAFVAISYDYIASRNNFGVGEFFQRRGPVQFIAAVVAIGIISYNAFLGEWWTVLVTLVGGWIGSQMLITMFRTGAQILSLLLMFGGLAYLILKL